ETKRRGVAAGVDVTDPRLWGGTRLMRTLLAEVGVRAGVDEEKFRTWAELPDLALLAIKWHVERTGPAWHWVVFVRDASGEYVLDPKRALRTNRRTDFGRMKPKWFIRIRHLETR
ncbi:MAG TPA: hypothetical protein VEQ65_01930, partial [Opitutus sp.]|nr:hypothetical protein [Opitutus sp.]